MRCGEIIPNDLWIARGDAAFRDAERSFVSACDAIPPASVGRVAAPPCGDVIFMLANVLATAGPDPCGRLCGPKHLWFDEMDEAALPAAMTALGPRGDDLVWLAWEDRQDHWLLEARWRDVPVLRWPAAAAVSRDLRWVFRQNHEEFALSGSAPPLEITHVARIARYRTRDGRLVDKERLVVRFADGSLRESGRALPGEDLHAERVRVAEHALARASGVVPERHDLTPWEGRPWNLF